MITNPYFFQLLDRLEYRHLMFRIRKLGGYGGCETSQAGTNDDDMNRHSL